MGFSTANLAQAQENPNFQAGIAAYQSNNLPLAYKEFLAAAQAGHPDSQFNVALMYEQGIGIGKDEKEAVSWYGKAAEQGHAAAQYNLAVLYENGRGTEIDCHYGKEARTESNSYGSEWLHFVCFQLRFMSSIAPARAISQCWQVAFRVAEGEL
jgi:TPR repeat protein